MHPAVVILFRVLSRVSKAQSQAECQVSCGTTIDLLGAIVKPEYQLRLSGPRFEVLEVGVPRERILQGTAAEQKP